MKHYFYKKRFILSNRNTTFNSLEKNNNSVMLIDKDIYERYKIFLNELIGKDKIQNRLSDPNCKGLIAIDRDSSEPIGFYWILIGSKSEKWHDKFKVQAGKALLFNAYVAKEHRGKGVYPSLIEFAHNYLKRDLGCNKVYTIVESNNYNSLRANMRCGLETVGYNYLIKFLGRNIFSIVHLEGSRTVDYVFKNKKSYSF